MTWADDVRRANEALDWIEARQGPLPATNYARIETDVRTVRAMAEGQDERISEWSESDELLRWTLEQHTRSLNNAGEQRCAQCYTRIPCDIAALAASGLARSARLDALAAERNTIQSAWTRDKALLDEAIDHHMSRWKKDEAERDALARLAAAEAALAPCTLAREYRDGVTCRDERDDKGVCFNHRVVRGLRVHAVTADRLELENRALRRQVRATYGIIHEGLHGGKPTDPEHQELCERPACRNARAALAGSTGGQEREGEGE